MGYESFSIIFNFIDVISTPAKTKTKTINNTDFLAMLQIQWGPKVSEPHGSSLLLKHVFRRHSDVFDLKWVIMFVQPCGVCQLECTLLLTERKGKK